MYINRQLDITVKDSLFDPDSPPGQRIAYAKRGGDRPLYKDWIYLDGNDLPYIESVTYELHPTFPEPRRTVERSVRNPRCALVIWTWGVFQVRVTLVDKKNAVYEIEHELTYGGELEKLSADDIRYEEGAANTASSQPVFKGVIKR